MTKYEEEFQIQDAGCCSCAPICWGALLGRNTNPIEEGIMVTKKQKLGEIGEVIITKKCSCPRCKRAGTFRRLPTNFKCADIICDFCGFLAQVKTTSRADLDTLPDKILGAAWSVQKERMDAGIYFPLYLVLSKDRGEYSIFYLSADLQNPELFIPRKPLSKDARRAGWQGFYYDLSEVKNAFVRLA
jgi:hypothetical protein